MVVNIVDKAKRIMGWCPNATAIVTKKPLQSDDLILSAPDREGKITHVKKGIWNTYRNRILLQSLAFILLAILLFVEHESVNQDMFLTGAIVGLFFRLLTGVNDWRRFNQAATRNHKQSRSIQKRHLITSFVMVSLIVVVIIFIIISFMRIAGMTGMQELFTGFLLFEWINYFKVLYWERKNGKTLIIEKAYLYTTDMKAGKA